MTQPSDGHKLKSLGLPDILTEQIQGVPKKLETTEVGRIDPPWYFQGYGYFNWSRGET